MTTYHMKQSIAGCLRNNRVGTIDFLKDKNGKFLSDAEARIELSKLLEAGHTVMPVGDDCEGFDVFGGGCPGHELLAGSDLSLELLRSHRDFIVAYVADTSDQDALENKNLKLVVGMDLTAPAFKTECGAWWNHAVAINSKTSQPLTAKEVGI